MSKVSAIVDIANIKPYHDYVLVKDFDRTKTSGGIYIKSSATPCVMGKVLAVGNGIHDDTNTNIYPLGIEPGETVLYMAYGGDKIEQDGETYRMIRCHGIWAKVKLKDEATYEVNELTPRSEFLLIEPNDETFTPGGLIYYANQQNMEAQWRRAIVLKVGPGKWRSDTGEREPIEVSIGEEIIFTRFAGAEVEINGKELRIIQASDITCGSLEEK